MKKHGFKIAIISLIIVIFAVAAGLIFFYMTQLSLAINGEEKMTLNLNEPYEEPGATGVFKGEDVSDEVKISGKVMPSRPGTYTISYKLGTLEAEREVTVLEEMNPVLTLEEINYEERPMLGNEFVEPGYQAVDENGRDITHRVRVTGNDFKESGFQTIVYTVEDMEGNVTRVERKVMVLPNTEYETAGLPICMYHYVYDENDPPEDLYERYGNYISVQDLEEELEWLNSEGYYYPTWEEVRAYIDGELLLPEKSIVLCFDDGAKSFLENGIPVLERCKAPATCFLITSNDGEEKMVQYESDYVTYQSHSHDMHRSGGYIGHGGIFTAIAYEDGMADLAESIRICGSSDAFAYPYGDYNELSRNMVEESGFLCGVTTQYGKAYPGDDPMLLPRVRMSMGQSLYTFANMVAPEEVYYEDLPQEEEYDTDDGYGDGYDSYDTYDGYE